MTELLLVVDLADVCDKFWHFFLVGGGGFTIDISMTYFLMTIVNWPKYLSNSAGFMCGVTFNYSMNRIWTFHSNDPNIALEYMKFATIGIIGLLLVNGMVYLLHSRWKHSFYRSKIASMVIFMCWNFSANYFYTFR